jgi:hypothetical protein
MPVSDRPDFGRWVYFALLLSLSSGRCIGHFHHRLDGQAKLTVRRVEEVARSGKRPSAENLRVIDGNGRFKNRRKDWLAIG